MEEDIPWQRRWSFSPDTKLGEMLQCRYDYRSVEYESCLLLVACGRKAREGLRDREIYLERGRGGGLYRSGYARLAAE